MSKMILNDWIRGRIPYFRMPPMNGQTESDSQNPINVKQLYNKIFVSSAFSKEDLEAGNEITTDKSQEQNSSTLNSETSKELDTENWDDVFKNVVGSSSETKELESDNDNNETETLNQETESSCDSELEISQDESIAKEYQSSDSEPSKRIKSRMTTNKKKIGIHYYDTANVKNKNRNKKRPLNPKETLQRIQKKKK